MKHYLKLIIEGRYLRIIIFSFIILTFLLLLAKNPFSQRSLIPNLEPFPDSIHYLNPALNLAHGKGLMIEREGRIAPPNVPFLYSLTLSPGFLLNDDVRFFYFTNVVLALFGLFVFYKFLSLIIAEEYTVYLILFLYVTNYFIFWLPNLPMAENLILPLYLTALYLLAAKISLKKAVLAAIIAVSFYATKFASLVLTLTFIILYSTKILNYLLSYNGKLSTSVKKEKLLIPTAFCLSVIISFGVFFMAEFLKGNNILHQIKVLIMPLLVAPPAVTIGQVSAPAETWFSLSYFNKNFPTYINAIMGNPMRFLWDFTPLVPKYIAIPGLIGIFAGLLTRGYRFISFSLLVLILAPIVFISTFYSSDARYIYNALPSVLAGFGLFINFTFLFFKEKNLQKVFYILLILFFLFYGFSNLYRLKYQISLNLRHAETPWYYVSAKTFNDFFISLPKTDKPPILINAMPPYYVDFYNTSGFRQLPLSTEQEFTKAKELVWGSEDYSDFIKLYNKYLREGNDLYLTNAGLGNEGYLYRDYNLIKDNFTLIRLKEGCLNTCDIYKITPKKR